MGHLELELVVGARQSVHGNTNHARFFDFSSACVAETALREDDEDVFVVEPLGNFFYSFAIRLPQCVTGRKEY